MRANIHTKCRSGLLLTVLICMALCYFGSPGYPGSKAFAGKGPFVSNRGGQATAQIGSPASHCTFCISPVEKSFTFEEGSGSVTVTAPAGCTWTATTDDDFITITSGGSGNEIVNYSLAANSASSRRTGKIIIAGHTFTIFQGIQFNDVPSDHLFFNEIGKLSARAITLGCGGGNFCPEAAVTREQMAAFIIRALGQFDPPAPASQRFQDVPPSNIFYSFIEQMAIRQITFGCSANPPLYCPSQPVTREQMAAFIIRALHEPGYVPPQPAQQRFQDVPPSNPFYAFIEEMAERGITLGCSANPPLYCPSQPVTRAQMAAFLIRAFDQPINLPPSVNAGSDQIITLPSTALLDASVADDGLPTCGLTLLWSQVSGPGLVTFSDPDAESTSASFSQPGTYTVRLMASDFQLTSTDDLTITVNPVNPNNQPPQINAGPDQAITLPSTASLSGTVSDDGVPSASALTASWNKVSGPGTVIFSNASSAATTALFSEEGSYVLRLIGSDSQLSSIDEVTITVNADPTPPPPDPETVAPPVNPTVATTIGTATEFLYTGASPIQTGVAPGTINPVQAAVIRGRVKNRGGGPLSNVKVTVLNHPEFGQTFTRADGWFDLAVNGDDFLTVRYEKNGFIPVQRQQSVAWQEYCVLQDVVMIGYDDRVTHIDLSAAIAFQVAQGSTSLDTDGQRRAVLMFQQGTIATMVLPDGSTQPLTNLHVRATEYTVGPSGPEAMPGNLPPTSAYTYAVEYSVDEAVAAGARSVQFSQPVINYTDNFLNFPIGGIVPVGGYERGQAAWMPSANGRVVRIVSIASGAAELDTDGDGVIDNGVSLGVTTAERQRLAELYSAGQSLWRVPINHFSPWDYNWPYGPPPDASGPPPMPPPPPPPDDPCEQGGSIIECQNQTLGESVALVGTPFSLNYRSDRVIGRRTPYTLDIPLSGASVPASLRRIELEVAVAGRQFTQTFPAAPNQRATFTWDGQDAYGRVLQGPHHPATVRVGYVYGLVMYKTPAQFASSFGDYGDSVLSGNRTRVEVTLWQQSTAKVGGWDARGQGLGGWGLSVHHVYDPVAQSLYLGDGRRRTTAGLPAIIRTVAGGGLANCSNTDPCGDGGPAIGVYLTARGIAVDGQGNLFIADSLRDKVRKVTPDGRITTVAGSGQRGFSGDGGPATQARLNLPQAVAVDAQGNLYIADLENYRVRKVDTAGIITTVAGNGSPFYNGDGIPATQAAIFVYDVAVAPDGSLYLADWGNHRIRRVAPDGIINTVAADSSPSLPLVQPYSVALDGQGNLFYSDPAVRRVYRLSPDGRITTVVSGSPGSTDDGVPATNATVEPLGIEVDRQGNLYIADNLTRRVRIVNPQGIISTVAGGGANVIANAADGLPATGAVLVPYQMAVDEQGNLLIADNQSALGRFDRVRKVSSVLPGLAGSIVIASEDGSQLYNFDAFGRHLSTLNALTGATVYTFAYDSAGRLTTITDGDGNVTSIERNASGQPTAIVAPFGQRTTLSLNGNGYLASIANPAGETTQCGYTNDGLLTSFTDPRGNVSQMTYDAQGQLVRDEAPPAGGGFWNLTRESSATSFTVSLTSALSRTTSYQVERLATGKERRVNTFPGGLQNSSTIGTNGRSTNTFPDGTMTTLVPGPDSRWGMQSPLDTSLTIGTPGGLTYTSTQTRAVTLSNPGDPLSLVTMADTFTTNGRAATSVYTAASRALTSTSAAGRQSSMLLDPQGRVLSLQIPGLAARQFTYDNRGRPATITQGSGADTRTITFGYGPQGFLSSITDPLMRLAMFDRDIAGRMTRQTLPDGREILFTYDVNGNITSITPPGRPAHTFTFTPLDFLMDYTPPIVGTVANVTHFTYDADRNLDLVTRPDGTTIDFRYDAAGRLGSIVIPRGQASFSYHPTSGNLSTITAPDGGTLAYSYDGNLLTGTVWSGTVTGTVQRTYNNDFHLASQSVNGAQTINFQYDNDGLLTQAGNLTLSRNAQNGFITATTLGGVTDAWSYSSFGEPVSYSASYSGSPIYSAQYTRDKLGRATRKTETIGGVTDTYDYTYDQAGLLTLVQKNGAATATYAYDSNSNRLSHTGPGGTVTGSYDNQDRLTGYGATTYAYTANGELLSKTVAGQTTTYEYDALNNLVRVNLPGDTQIDYTIDGYNRRIGKKVNGVLTQGLLYQDRLRPVAELDGNNQVVSRFIYGARRNVPEYMIRGGATYRIISDQLGSPRLVVNVATGAIAQRLDYDEFGVVLADSNPGFQPFGFAGGIYDSHTKLTRFGVRDYDAETGRWTGKDPLLFGGGDTNLYGYVLNDPVNWVDPTGTQGTPLADALREAQKKPRKGDQNLENLLRKDGYTNPEDVVDDWLWERGVFDDDYIDTLAGEGQFGGRESVNPKEYGDFIGDSLRDVPPNNPGGGSSGGNSGSSSSNGGSSDGSGTSGASGSCKPKPPKKPPCTDCDAMLRRYGRIVGPCQVWPPCP